MRRGLDLLLMEWRDKASPSNAKEPALRNVLLLLPLRLVLFLVFQGLVALLARSFVSDPWTTSIIWWPLSVVLVNLVTIAILFKLLLAEGRSYADLLCIDRAQLRADLLPLLGLGLLLVILAVGPNLALAKWLFGSMEAPAELFLRPLPHGAAYVLLLLFPLTIALSEIPLYFGYIAVHLQRLTQRRWLSVAVPAFFAAAQHVTMPLLFDLRFVVWRLLMFIPLSLFLGLTLAWRPRYLTYFVVIHGLLDMSVILAMF